MTEKTAKADESSEETQESTENPEGSEAERNFWSRFDERLDAAIERGVRKHVPKRPTGTQRNDGRTTLPGLIASFMGGPFDPKPDKK